MQESSLNFRGLPGYFREPVNIGARLSSGMSSDNLITSWRSAYGRNRGFNFVNIPKHPIKGTSHHSLLVSVYYNGLKGHVLTKITGEKERTIFF